MPHSCYAPSAPARDSKAVAAVTTTRPGSPDDMVHLAGDEFLMGNAGRQFYPDDGEGPTRRVRLDPFWIDTCAVSNAGFAQFVEETGQVTRRSIPAGHSCSPDFCQMTSRPPVEWRMRPGGGRSKGRIRAGRRVRSPVSTAAWTTRWFT